MSIKRSIKAMQINVDEIHMITREDIQAYKKRVSDIEHQLDAEKYDALHEIIDLLTATFDIQD